ncbi:MAG: hypothetical protein CL565_04155 [Alphaproteobacteria bacterium]|nr:hypothetical protein [Alphaproteobacteria bacterium]
MLYIPITEVYYLRLMFSKTAFKILVSITLIAFLAINIDLSSFIKSASSFDSKLAAGSVLLVICQIYFLNLRWHQYLNEGQTKVPFKRSVLINIAGFFANILFISSIGGIIAKSGLAIREGLSVTRSVFATFLDRFMSMAALLFFSACGLPLLIPTLDQKIGIALALSIFVIMAVLMILIIVLRSGLLKSFIFSNRKRLNILAITRSYTENYSLMSKTFLYSIIAQGFFILSVYVLSLGVNSGTGHVWEFLALIPVLAVISSLPISFGGWGVRESAFIYGLGLIGFTIEDAFFLSLQVGAVGLIAPSIVALTYYFAGEKITIRKLLKANEA